MELSENLSIIGKLINDDHTSEAEKLLNSDELKDNPEPMLLLYRALCIYERKDDLECLRLLGEFLSQTSNHKKADYAKYTAAVCLLNLGLEERAIGILESIPKDYPDLEKELSQTRERILKKKRAVTLLTNSLKFPQESLE